MSPNTYLDFDLLIESDGPNYRASVIDSPAGQAANTFTLPFSEKDLEILVLQVFRLTSRRSVRAVAAPQMKDVRSFGGHLFESIFSGPVGTCLLRSMDEADRTNAGLRVRLHLGDAPKLANIPWEFLYDSSSDGFLGLSDQTPLVRYIDLPQLVEPLAAMPPLRMLCLISSPAGYPPLDVEHEWAKLNEALGPTIKEGRLVMERIDTPSLEALQRRLRREEYHVLHFVGHGAFDEQAQDGVLLLETLDGEGHPVTGESLGVLLHDHESLRLVVLNACEGARTSSTDPFAGTAQSLVRKGIPAVIAMQFEISDVAAITLANEFYSAVADGYPVDAALSEARKAIFTRVNAVEWATPVLYMRSPDGRIFEIEDQDERKEVREKHHEEVAAAAAALASPPVVEPAPVALQEPAPVTRTEPSPVAVEPSVQPTTPSGRDGLPPPTGRPAPGGIWPRYRAAILGSIAAVVAVIVLLVVLLGGDESGGPRTGPTRAPSPTTEPSAPAVSTGDLLSRISFVPVSDIQRAASGSMLRVIQGGTAFSAVGSDASKATIWLSADAASWLKQEMPPAVNPLHSGQVQGIVELPSALVTAGYERSARDKQYAVAWTLSSGDLSWTAKLLGPEGSFVNRVGIVSDNAVAVGRNGKAAGLWTSGDGITWSRSKNPVFAPSGGETLTLRDVFEGAFHAVVVGEDSVGGAAAWYFTKPDGAWIRAEVEGPHKDQSLISVAGGPDRFVAVGYDTLDGDEDGAVWTSTDGTTWERAPNPGRLHQSGNQRMRGVTYVPGVGFVAVGVTRKDAAVWTSPDGLEWIRSEAALSRPGEREMTGIISSANQLIAVGKDEGRAAIWIAELRTN